MIGVQDDWDPVCGSNSTNVLGTGDTTSNGSLLVTVGNTLTVSELFLLS